MAPQVTPPPSGGNGGNPNAPAPESDVDGGSQSPEPGPSASASTPGPDVAAPSEQSWSTITNGDFWNDTDGKRIEAHGAGILQVADTWYWIGEDKSHNSGNFKGVNLYASKDLQHWEFKKAIITRDTSSRLDTQDRIIERPKLTFNDMTQKYVVWLHWEGQNYADAEAGVFTCDTVDGDYTYVNDFRPKDNMARDDNLFKDDDGTAYFMAAANENRDMIIYRLTDDYLDIAEQVVTLWKGAQREAPAMFKVDGRYYMITSHATGWDPNQAGYASAPAIDGPWTDITDMADSTTYDTQSTYVLPIMGSEKTTYMYLGDRWQDPDLVSSKYIWLPLKVNGQKLALDYYDTWRINVATGEWDTDATDEFVSQANWKLLYVDSEETVKADDPATNAFDDSPSTFWHTEWDESKTPPHEIQIDMGESLKLGAFRYIPRQDTDDHGIVDQYEFYVSDDSNDWGEPVNSGSWGSGRATHTEEFTAKQGRYLRFVAKREINGSAWTSVAELDVKLAN